MVRRVLVARLDSDGDVLLAGPAVRAVASQSTEVTLLCGPRGVAAARLLPGIDRLIVHRAPWIDPDPKPIERQVTLALVEELAALELDEAIVLTSFHQSPLPLALLLRLGAVPMIAAICEDYPGSLLDVRHWPERGLHEVERNLSLAGTLGYRLCNGDSGRLEVLRPARGWKPPLERPYVVVHPGASVSARAWAPQRHAALVEELLLRGHRVAVTGSSSERQLTAVVSGEPRAGVVDLGGATDLPQLAETFAGATCVVVGNTGPAHLAAALGAPVVSLFAPTVPAERWRPWRVPHVLLGLQDLPCGGCRARCCPVAGHPCLDSITVEEVADAVETVAPLRVNEVAAA